MFAALIGAPCFMEIEFTNEEDLVRVPIKKEGSADTDVRGRALAPWFAGTWPRTACACERVWPAVVWGDLAGWLTRCATLFSLHGVSAGSVLVHR